MSQQVSRKGKCCCLPGREQLPTNSRFSNSVMAAGPANALASGSLNMACSCSDSKERDAAMMRDEKLTRPAVGTGLVLAPQNTGLWCDAPTTTVVGV